MSDINKTIIEIRDSLSTILNLKKLSEKIISDKNALLEWHQKETIQKQQQTNEFLSLKENEYKAQLLQLQEIQNHIPKLHNDLKDYKNRVENFMLNNQIPYNPSEINKTISIDNSTPFNVSILQKKIKELYEISYSITSTEKQKVFGGWKYFFILLGSGYVLSLIIGYIFIELLSLEPIANFFFVVLLLIMPFLGFVPMYKYPSSLFANIVTYQKLSVTIENYIKVANNELEKNIRKLKDEFDALVHNNKNTLQKVLITIENIFESKKKQISKQINLLNENIINDSISLINLEKNVKKYDYCMTPLSDPLWKKWVYEDTVSFPNFLRIGSINLNSLTPFLPNSENLYVDLPILIPMEHGINIVASSSNLSSDNVLDDVKSFFHNIMLRCLALNRAGDVLLYLIDPYGSGSCFDIFSKVKDINNKLINKKICTTKKDIQDTLHDLNNEISLIIQGFLQDNFKSVYAYNQMAKNDNNISTVPVPNRILGIFGYPKYFEGESVALLKDLLKKGPLCGISTFLIVDEAELNNAYNQKTFLEEAVNNLKNHTYHFRFDNPIRQNNLNASNFKNFPGESFLNTFISIPSSIDNDPLLSKTLKAKLELDLLPEDDSQRQKMNDILVDIAKNSEKTMKIEIPFNELLITYESQHLPNWEGDTINKVKCPIGIKGGKDLHFFEFDSEEKPHGIVIGKTGSGKTNLFHVIINSLSLIYSPNEIELHLIDFKKGVGFKPYADFNLPHCKTIAIESDREYGLSILENINIEMTKRANIFKKITSDKENIEKYSQYRNVIDKNFDSPMEYLPRILLIIDEFQVLFSENDNICRKSVKLLENIARLGRSFGIHFLLGSQTLKGISTEISGSAVFTQIPIRILLLCNKSDSDFIFGLDNDVSRLIKRAGHGYYNDLYGDKDNNVEFQISLIDPSDLDTSFLRINQLKMQHFVKDKEVVVFDGSSDFRLDNNRDFLFMVKNHHWLSLTESPKLILGIPASIKNSLRFTFFNKSSYNFLIINKQSSEGLSLALNSLICLALQYKPNDIKFYLYNMLNMQQVSEENEIYADNDFLNSFEESMLFHEYTTCKDHDDFETSINEVYEELGIRMNNQPKSIKRIYFFILGLQFLRNIDLNNIRNYNSTELNFSFMLKEIIHKGPDYGIHLVILCNNYSKLESVFDSKTIKEFGLKALSLMTSSDSTRLIGTDEASKLEKGRYIFKNDEEGDYCERFRGFVAPNKKLIDKINKFFKSNIMKGEK